MWWPGLAKDAALFPERCSVCWRKQTNVHLELSPTEIEGVWEKLAVDLVTIEGHHLLSVVACGSRYLKLLELGQQPQQR